MLTLAVFNIKIKSMDLIEISENTNRHPWEIARKIIVNKWMSKLIQKKKFKILDVGSGDAYLADSFTNAFPESIAFCVDTGYTIDMINTISNNLGNNNLNFYPSLEIVKGNDINIVTLLDVLEHVPNDVELLNKIINQPYINSETCFIITVPAFQSLFSNHDNLLKHYRRYNLRDLKRTINECGLKSFNSGYFFSILITPRVLQLIVEKVLAKNKRPDNLGKWRGSKATTSLIKNVLLLDFKIGEFLKIIGINLPGLSCYIICKKK